MFQRDPLVCISFDFSSMELCPATIPDLGRETAAARHCQVVLKQHQLPFSRSPNAIKLHPQDLVVDAAHFATLYTNGHSESVIANTIELQLLHSESNTPPTAWSSTFTTCLALATEATFLWGCTGLTWVTQYPHYISSDNADALLGSTAFHLGLQSRLYQSIIFLNAFGDDRQALYSML